MIKSLLLFLLIFLSLQTLGRSIEDIIDDSLPEAEIITKEILSSFPPDQYHYIGIGRSPLLLTAYLEAHGYDSSNIPISELNQASLAPNSLDLLVKHISSFLPSGSKDKNFLLIDFSFSGESILNLDKAINVLTAEKPNMSIEYFLTVGKSRLETVSTKLASLKRGVTYSKIEEIYPSLGLSILNHEFGPYAEFETYTLADMNSHPPIQNTTAHQTFKNTLKKKLENSLFSLKSNKNLNRQKGKSYNCKSFL